MVYFAMEHKRFKLLSRQLLGTQLLSSQLLGTQLLTNHLHPSGQILGNHTQLSGHCPISGGRCPGFVSVPPPRRAQTDLEQMLEIKYLPLTAKSLINNKT